LNVIRPPLIQLGLVVIAGRCSGTGNWTQLALDHYFFVECGLHDPVDEGGHRNALGPGFEVKPRDNLTR